MQANKDVVSFVDRDMFMRYRGGGVGHTYMRVVEQWLQETGWGHEVPDADEPEPYVAAEDEGLPQQEEPEDGSDLEAGSNFGGPDELGGGDDNEGETVEEEDDDEGEILEDEALEEEDTVEGEFGYSTF
jgi:hypothetical protein